MEYAGTMELRDGRLMVGGCDVEETARTFGTPLILYDEAGIEERACVFLESFRSDRFQSKIIYASKALSNLYLLGLMDRLGLYLDVVSGGELHVARHADFPMDRVYFHGNNKTRSELRTALELGVGTIVADHPGEVELLTELLAEETRATQEERKQRVLLRVNPGIEAKTHKYIQTTTEESKFGMSTENPSTDALIRKMLAAPRIDFAGFHCHIGSQILDEAFFFEEAEDVLHFARRTELEHACRIREVNLGGGFGVRYHAGETGLDYPVFLRRYAKLVETILAETGLAPEYVSLEPGRSLVNPFGSTVYEVGGIKFLPGGVNYLFVDGGMTDNPRPALYEAKYEAMVLNRSGAAAAAAEPKRYRIAGKCCETGDVLIQEQVLAKVDRGDLLLVHGTGAYTYSMSSNYNHLPRPAVVFLKEGKVRTAVRRETYEDLLLRDLPYQL